MKIELFWTKTELLAKNMTNTKLNLDFQTHLKATVVRLNLKKKDYGEGNLTWAVITSTANKNQYCHVCCCCHQERENLWIQEQGGLVVLHLYLHTGHANLKRASKKAMLKIVYRVTFHIGNILTFWIGATLCTYTNLGVRSHGCRLHINAALKLALCGSSNLPLFSQLFYFLAPFSAILVVVGICCRVLCVQNGKVTRV